MYIPMQERENLSTDNPLFNHVCDALVSSFVVVCSLASVCLCAHVDSAANIAKQHHVMLL